MILKFRVGEALDEDGESDYCGPYAKLWEALEAAQYLVFNGRIEG